MLSNNYTKWRVLSINITPRQRQPDEKQFLKSGEAHYFIDEPVGSSGRIGRLERYETSLRTVAVDRVERI